MSQHRFCKMKLFEFVISQFHPEFSITKPNKKYKKNDFCYHVISKNHYAILISQNYVVPFDYREKKNLFSDVKNLILCYQKNRKL